MLPQAVWVQSFQPRPMPWHVSRSYANFHIAMALLWLWEWENPTKTPSHQRFIDWSLGAVYCWESIMLINHSFMFLLNDMTPHITAVKYLVSTWTDLPLHRLPVGIYWQVGLSHLVFTQRWGQLQRKERPCFNIERLWTWIVIGKHDSEVGGYKRVKRNRRIALPCFSIVFINIA